jgi:hypothetical protein
MALKSVNRNDADEKRESHTGKLICSREAASFSPGASNPTTGAPNVTPMRLANEDPNECPTSQIFESGYI